MCLINYSCTLFCGNQYQQIKCLMFRGISPLYVYSLKMNPAFLSKLLLPPSSAAKPFTNDLGLLGYGHTIYVKQSRAKKISSKSADVWKHLVTWR